MILGDVRVNSKSVAISRLYHLLLLYLLTFTVDLVPYQKYYLMLLCEATNRERNARRTQVNNLVKS
ncbi:hypothetical protein SPYJRS4_0643 [Streptococcus pyogenes JRS4]|nr:Hypothetical protein M6_Spy0661 [Streptococcus pyogenes MGAS10394]BAR44143.1 hypothetical protein SPYJRS4_0643 [Streptococcus pyogenes JRS4]